MKISIIRGAFLNPFELQNYYPLVKRHEITAISSKHPINSNIKLRLVQLWSLTDLPEFPYKFPIINRLAVDAHYLFGLEKIIAGTDIAHVAETYFYYTIQAIKAKQKGLVKKIVSTCWEIIPHNNESIRGRKEFKQLSYQWIEHFICPTELAKFALVTEGVPEKKISVIKMGVDLNRFKPLPKKSGKYLRILFVGRLVEEKGVFELLDAFQSCRSSGLKVHLTMIGSGPLKQRALKAGASVKQITYEQIHHEYQSADVFCLPSKNTPTWQEQYGIVLVEAMACGLPIITSGNGATKEVCSDAAAYAKSSNDIFKAITKIQDKNLAGKMARKSLIRAKHEFDSRNIAKQLEKFYKSIL